MRQIIKYYRHDCARCGKTWGHAYCTGGGLLGNNRALCPLCSGNKRKDFWEYEDELLRYYKELTNARY